MLTNNDNGFTMPVVPMTNGGFGGFGNDGAWWLLILLFALGGLGNGFGGYGGGSLAADGAMLYPWMNQSNQITGGFRDQMLNDNITEIRTGVGSIASQLCNGFAGVTQTVNSGFANAETAANARQMANMQTAFAAQTAMSQGFSDVAAQLAQCCCDNRLATCQTQNIVQNEGNATRFADANNTRDIIQSQTNGTQAILDKLCQLELDNVKAQVEAKNDKIIELQNQLNMAAFRESQTAQNALFAQGMTNEVDELYNRLSNCPGPCTPVYGKTPIFTCNNNGCGCGM